MKLLRISPVLEEGRVFGNRNGLYNKLRSFIFWHYFRAKISRTM